MKLIKNNWKLKLLSLIGAIVLWSFVISIENPTVTRDLRDIPVVFENENVLNDKGLVLLNDSKPKVNISIKGPRNKIVNLTNQHIRVSADLRGYNEGLSPLKFEYDMPDDIELVIEPELINIEIQKIITKSFHVEVDTVGEMKEAFILESTKATPEKISVKGPRGLVESIDSISAKLEISNLYQDLVTNLDIEALTKDGQVVDNVILGQNFVNINATVSKSKEIAIIANHDNNLPENVRLLAVTMDPKSVYVKGDESIIDKLEEVKTSKIDLSKIDKTSEVDVELNLPEGVSLLNKELAFKARVDVEKMIEKTLDVPVSKIELSGVTGDKIATYEKEYLSVRILGYEEDIVDITGADISLSYVITENQEKESFITPIVKGSDKFKIRNVESIKMILE